MSDIEMDRSFWDSVVCPCCGVLFERPRSGVARLRKYCSKSCGAKHTSASEVWGIPKGSMGAYTESVVQADLLRRGWYVYRSVSPNAPVDLVAVSDEEMFMIECRTAHLTSKGELSFIRKIHSHAPPGRVIFGLFVVESKNILYLDTDGNVIDIPYV